MIREAAVKVLDEVLHEENARLGRGQALDALIPSSCRILG
jgi:hypothetical protein